MAQQREEDVCFLLLIAVQWLFVGGFPPRQSLRLWGEPGMFITLCALAAAPFALFHRTEVFSRLPMIFAFVGWVWWSGLLVWRLLRVGVGWVVRRPVRNAG